MVRDWVYWEVKRNANNINRFNKIWQVGSHRVTEKRVWVCLWAFLSWESRERNRKAEEQLLWGWQGLGVWVLMYSCKRPQNIEITFLIKHFGKVYLTLLREYWIKKYLSPVTKMNNWDHRDASDSHGRKNKVKVGKA